MKTKEKKDKLLKETDFESLLSYGTLVRYKNFFEIKQNEEDLYKKEVLARLVSDHFNELELNDHEVLENFLKIDKDTNLINNQNTRKSARNQEKFDFNTKLDKNKI